jgi:hypothetical protein
MSNNRRLYLSLALAALATVVCGLLAIGFVINAAGAGHDHGASRVGQAVGAAICVALAIAAARWAVHVERRLRSHQPVARSYHEAHIAPATRRVARRRRYGPTTTAVLALLFLGGTAGFTAGAVVELHEAQRSSFVQHHGISAHATVVYVDNDEHCSRSGCDWTSAITVVMTPPVDGESETVVHYPDFSDLEAGDRVAVLIDPRQPNYAELPGRKLISSGTWIAFVVFAALFALLALGDLLALFRQLAHRRRFVAGSPPAAASSA